jgi:hypothetical protein
MKVGFIAGLASLAWKSSLEIHLFKKAFVQAAAVAAA